MLFNDYATAEGKRGLPDGHAELARVISVPVIENGKVVMLTGVGNKATDYTDDDVETVQLIANEMWRIIQRQRSQKKIARFSRMLEQSLNEIYVFDSQTLCFVDVNLGARTNLGYTLEEIRRMTPLDLLPELTADSFQQLVAPLRSGERRHIRFPAMHRRKDGTQYPVEVNLELSDDDPPVFVSVILDVTERTQAETELRIAATAMESREGMVISDANCVILRTNQAFAKITGYAVEEAVGRKTNLLKSGRHDGEFYAAMWETINRDGSWNGEVWNQRKNGEVYPVWLTVTAVRGTAGNVTHYVGSFSDITQRMEAESRIKELAFYDPLTRLPNRRLLLDRLRQAMAASARGKREGGLMFIDLDNFKTLNDTLGHAKGDLLLQQVAERLTSHIREGDTVARLGGDEFVVMLEDLAGNPREAAAQVKIVGEKILAALNEPYLLASSDYHSTASIGATLFGLHPANIDDLLKQADIAMYQAKAAGRNTLRFFDPELQAAVRARATLETELRQGIGIVPSRVEIRSAGVTV